MVEVRWESPLTGELLRKNSRCWRPPMLLELPPGMMLIMATLSGTERLGLRTALSVAIYMPRMLKVVNDVLASSTHGR